MRRVIYRCLIKKDKVLINTTSPDKKTGIPFTCRSYAGQ